MSDSLEDRATGVLELVEPLRRATALEMDVDRRTWWRESDAQVAEVLGCSRDALARLADRSSGRSRPAGQIIPSDQLRLHEALTYKVELPLGGIDGDDTFSWIVITRDRYPATPAHQWQLERHRLRSKQEAPGRWSANYGWFWPNLTSAVVAIACDPGVPDYHYSLTHDKRRQWMQAGVSHGTAPRGAAAVEAQVCKLVQIQQQNTTAFRLQVCQESWTDLPAEENPRWSYRILDAAGDVVRANSSEFSRASKYDHGYETRTKAVRAGQAALSRVVGYGDWETVP